MPAKLARVLPRVHPNVYIGTLGVFFGAGIATLNGRLISVGLPDLRGAMGLGVDEASWISTAYNMALMFMGPFSVYLGALLGVRRVLLPAAVIFILCSILLPFSPNLGVMLALQVISGLSSGTFYPLTLTYALRSLPMRYTIYGIGVYSIDIIGVTNLAVDLLVQRPHHAADDVLHLPGYPESPQTSRAKAGHQLAGLSLRRARAGPDLWRARSGRAARLAQFRGDRRHAGDGRLPDPRRRGPAVVGT